MIIINFNGIFTYFTLEIKSVLAKPYFSTYLVGKSVLDGRQIDTKGTFRGKENRRSKVPSLQVSSGAKMVGNTASSSAF